MKVRGAAWPKPSRACLCPDPARQPQRCPAILCTWDRPTATKLSLDIDGIECLPPRPRYVEILLRARLVPTQCCSRPTSMQLCLDIAGLRPLQAARHIVRQHQSRLQSVTVGAATVTALWTTTTAAHRPPLLRLRRPCPRFWDTRRVVTRGPRRRKYLASTALKTWLVAAGAPSLGYDATVFDCCADANLTRRLLCATSRASEENSPETRKSARGGFKQGPLSAAGVLS